jgi:hypothetical protein
MNKVLAVTEEIEMGHFEGQIQSFWQYLTKLVHLTERQLTVIDLELQMET